MALRKIKGIIPHRVALKKGGSYFACTCGKGTDGIFCNGAHAGTEFRPVAFEGEQDGEAYLCACGHSNTHPYCDGSHKQLDESDIGREIRIS